MTVHLRLGDSAENPLFKLKFPGPTEVLLGIGIALVLFGFFVALCVFVLVAEICRLFSGKERVLTQNLGYEKEVRDVF